MLNIYNPNNHDGDKTAGLVKNGAPNGKGSVPVKTKFAKYEDPTKEFSSQELQWSFWYVQHKALLYKILIIILIVINAGFALFGIWRWGEYLLGWSDYGKLEKSLTASVNYTGIHPRFAAQPIQVVNTQVFAGQGNKYDIVAELVNPNSRFLVWFDYYFVVNGIKTSAKKTFLLPGESRFAAALGLEDTGGSPAVVLENIKYERISNHQVADVAAYQTERLNFQASDFVFSKSLDQEGTNADAIRFKLTNASPYSYVAADFYVALLQNSQMVGIVPLHLDSINSLQIKEIDIRSFVPNLSITEIAVYPIINIYDRAAYAQ
ncbi:MAG: hypothetical protein HYT15_03580 [Candidatus Magasanikbacteria bacterium]|nr:hypothetical protein [Candidatus Magasanikbacteria bacterium]